jgi:hypothetical protein
VITITLDADQLYANNLVVVTLDDTISDTDENTLGADHEFFFSTTLDPYYAGVRLVQLKMGTSGRNIPSETLAFAIWDASREASAIASPVIADAAAFSVARRNFVVCSVIMGLMGGTKVSGGGARKRIADLDISRDAGGTTQYMRDLQGCIDRYELALRSGADAGFGAGVKPQTVVKGDTDPDNPPFGRRWVIPSVPMGNIRTNPSGYNRYYHSYNRR